MPRDYGTISPPMDATPAAMSVFTAEINHILDRLGEQLSNLEGYDGQAIKLASDLDLGGKRLRGVGSSVHSGDSVNREELETNALYLYKGQHYAKGVIIASQGLELPERRPTSSRGALSRREIEELISRFVDANAAPIDAEYLVVTTNTDLTNESVLTAGANITLTPGVGTLTVAATGVAAGTEAYVTIGNTAGLSAERALTAGTNISIIDDGANSTVTVAISGADLNAIEALASTGYAVRTASNTWAQRSISTTAGTGLQVVNGDGVAGNTTINLANDVQAIEALSGTGIAVRTTTNTWAQRTVVDAGSGRVTVTNPGGVAGNITLDVAQASLDHGSIGGLTDDDHAQYALLVGRSGGQSLRGSTLTTENLTLAPNAADSTTGQILFGTGAAYDAAEQLLLAGTQSPTATIDRSTSSLVGGIEALATSSRTATPNTVLVLRSESTATPAAGFGGQIVFVAHDAGNTAGGDVVGRVGMVWATPTAGSEDGRLDVSLRDGGGGPTTIFQLDQKGRITLPLATAPASVPASKLTLFAQSPNEVLYVRTNAGTSSLTSFPITASGSQFLTGLGADGIFTRAQPAFTDVSGTLAVTAGGTGRTTSTTAYALLAAGTTAAGAHQTLAAGATTEILVGGGAAALPVWTAAQGTGAPVRKSYVDDAVFDTGWFAAITPSTTKSYFAPYSEAGGLVAANRFGATPIAGTTVDLYVASGGALAGGTVTIAYRNLTAGTEVSATIADGTASASNIGAALSFSAGDKIQFSFVASTALAANNFSASVRVR